MLLLYFLSDKIRNDGKTPVLKIKDRNVNPEVNLVKHVIWSVLRKQLTGKYRLLFPQNTPS